MWRSPASLKRITPSPSPSPSPNASSPEPDAQASFRRRPTPTAKSALAEALKSNPFKTSATRLRIEDPVTSLNNDLKNLADVYTDIKIEVLRELLLRFDGESRLYICAEQLVRHKSKWANGRLLNPPRDSDTHIPQEELFRSETYIVATRKTLVTEFKSLNKSAVDAVLAEVNNSYHKARPTLQGIAAKSWRATFTAFFKKRKGSDEPPPFLIGKSRSGYTVLRTGDHELDQELDQLFLANSRRQQQTLQEENDNELAIALNQEEAEKAKALFECQVCYNDVTFESITTCSGNAHTICRDCVRRSLNEALFGQGWAQSVDVAHGTLRCVAPNTNESCGGHIPPSLLQLVLLSSPSGYETWRKFEERLALDNMTRSGLPLVHCPFCYYAETSQIRAEHNGHSVNWQFRKQKINLSILLLILLVEFLLPILVLVLASMALASPGLPQRMFETSLNNIHRQIQTQRFRCKNPACARNSCLSCLKSWYDPHTCHEPLIISLRTAVEAARTAALKRTCPRCGTSFVKSSGCNKLTCVCGYAMCYLCRKNIGKVNNNGAVDDREGGEGYRHFCEHFRLVPGQKCTECNKCDLYMNEDQEVAVKKAGEEAEREWREKEGMIGVKGLGLEEAVGQLGKLGDDSLVTVVKRRLIAGDWTAQEVCDWVVAKLVIVES